jgi:Fur family peroxide stress response transcriptional regulator
MVSRVEELLLEKGVKPTPQRVVIAEYIMSTDCHPTADQILDAVATKLPVQLSRATVYNTLKTLVDARVILEVFTEPGRARYDANIEEHHHFVDVKTGRILDVPAALVPQLKDQLGGKFKVHNYSITFYGEVADGES